MDFGFTHWPRRVGLGAAVVGLLVTAACTRAEPGVVAYVGDDRITEQQVDEAVGGISSTLEEGQTVSTEAVVNAMIHGELADQVAAKEQLVITDADRVAILKDSNLAPLLDVAAAKPVLFDVADAQIVTKKLGTRYLTEIAKINVTLNPRYGVLDQSQKTIVSDESGSLAKPASPSATP
jgi:hypothetical protein